MARTPAHQVPKWFAAAGFSCLAVFIAFLMWLIISDHVVPHDNRMLLVFLLAVILATASAFLGGTAAASGSLPAFQNKPIKFSVGGAAAVFVITVLIGYLTYARELPEKERDSLLKQVEHQTSELRGIHNKGTEERGPASGLTTADLAAAQEAQRKLQPLVEKFDAKVSRQSASSAEIQQIEDARDLLVCAEHLSECPDRGCALAGSAAAASNVLKRHIPTNPPRALTFADFITLQKQADSRVGSGKPIEPDKRASLSALKVAGGTVSEGDAVRVLGYLVRAPHTNIAGESVNCGLKGAENNDLTLSVAQTADAAEQQSVVVEMIPQNRPEAWTRASLLGVFQEKRQVWIEGNLYYDNLHRVNADPDSPVAGQPKRASLWEIHPVTKFFVCAKEPCNIADTSGWTAL